MHPLLPLSRLVSARPSSSDSLPPSVASPHSFAVSRLPIALVGVSLRPAPAVAVSPGLLCRRSRRSWCPEHHRKSHPGSAFPAAEFGKDRCLYRERVTDRSALAQNLHQ